MIYVATVQLGKHEYPDRNWREETTEIVEADNEEEAKEKIRSALEVNSPYSHRTDVWGIELKAMIR